MILAAKLPTNNYSVNMITIFGEFEHFNTTSSNFMSSPFIVVAYDTAHYKGRIAVK